MNYKKVLISLSAFSIFGIAFGGVLLSFENSNPIMTKADVNATQTIYFDGKGSYDKGSEKLFVHSWGSEDYDVAMELVGGHIYKADIPANNTSVIFVRCDPNYDVFDWSHKYNQTVDVTLKKECLYSFESWAGEKDNVSYDYDFYVQGSMGGSGWAKDDKYMGKLEFDNSNNPQWKVSIEFKKNDEFKVTQYGTYYGYNKLETASTALKDGLLSGSGDSNVKAESDFTATFYIKANKEFYIDYDANLMAESYSTTFMSTVTCDGGVTKPSVTAWNSMKTAYESLPAAAQGVLWLSETDEEGDIVKQAMYRYDYIIEKYGKTTYADFINRHPSDSAMSNSFKNSINNGGNNSSTVIGTITISAVALATIGGLFLYRKHKTN